MRFDLHKVRSYLVNEMQESPAIARVEHDGTDVIICQLMTGESVIIHLIERLMPINDIKATLDENNAAFRHTVFILWGDMLLPPENRLYQPDDWMEALFTLYDGLIYGYDSFGPYASVFPVYFEKQPQSYQRFIRYGEAINVSRLHCDIVHINLPEFKGFWRVADFEPRRTQEQATNGCHAGQSAGSERQRPLTTERNSMSTYYAVLMIAHDADREVVRAAYRKLAREHHPDLNDSPDSTSKMQEINEAYERIMQQFGDD
jgi:DnaJ domain